MLQSVYRYKHLIAYRGLCSTNSHKSGQIACSQPSCCRIIMDQNYEAVYFEIYFVFSFPITPTYHGVEDCFDDYISV